jgi:hypothetical protein
VVCDGSIVFLLYRLTIIISMHECIKAMEEVSPSTADENGIFENGYAVGLLSGVWPASIVMIGDVGLEPGPAPAPATEILRAPKVLSGVIGGGVPSVDSDDAESERDRACCPLRPPMGIPMGSDRLVLMGDAERTVVVVEVVEDMVNEA